MAKGKRKNPTNRNQDHSPSSEPRTPTSPSPGHPNTPEKVDLDLKAYLMMMVEDIKKDFNKSLKEIQENTTKELQVLIEKQENTSKQMMEMNKTILDLKREVNTIKKTQSEASVFRRELLLCVAYLIVGFSCSPIPLPPFLRL